MADEEKPDVQSIAVKRQMPAVKIVRDVYAGTLQLRESGTEHLPQWPKESDAAYQTRLDLSTLFNALRRTARGLVGMIFRKQVELGPDLDSDLIDHSGDIDQAGTSLNEWLRRWALNLILDGHAVIWVDMPVMDDRFETKADQPKDMRRPYWSTILKQDILRFRTERIGGRVEVVRFAYRESSTEDSGQFGEVEIERVREYRLAVNDGNREVSYRVWKRLVSGDDSEWKEDGGEKTLGIGRIPIAVGYADQVGVLESRPPLEDLAHENLRHWRTQSDNEAYSHVAKVPILMFTGVSAKEIGQVTVGSGVGVAIPASDAKGSYLQPDADVLRYADEQLIPIEKRMAILGLSMLMSDTRAAETAESKRIDKSESDSALASMAVGLKEAVEQAYQLHGLWLGKEVETSGKVTVNTDFLPEGVDPAFLNFLLDLVDRGKLSLETLWERLRHYAVLGDDFDPELEYVRLGGAPPIPGEESNQET